MRISACLYIFFACWIFGIQHSHAVDSDQLRRILAGMGDTVVDRCLGGATLGLSLQAHDPMVMSYDSLRAEEDTIYGAAAMRYAVAWQLYHAGYFVESNRLSASAAASFYSNRDFKQAFYSLLLQVGSLMHMGAYHEAFPTVLRAHTLAWNQHDASLIAMAQDWIGQLYMSQGNAVAAILYYEDAVARTRGLEPADSRQVLSLRLGHVAEAYVGAGRYDDALRAADESISLAASVKGSGVHALLARGAAYAKLGDYHAAEESYQMALTGSRAVGQAYEEILTLRHLGILRADQLRFGAADTLFARAFALATLQAMHPMRASLLHLRAQMARGKDPLRALVYLEEYVALSDSLSRLSARQQMNALYARYESELKQRRIEVQDLQLGRAAILRRILLLSIALAMIAVVLLMVFLHHHRMRNRHLAVLNQTKDLFFSVISHDTKNLSIAIRNMLTQMDANLDRLTKEQIADYIGLLHGASEDETNLLDNLLRWANVQLKTEQWEPKAFDAVTVVRGVASLFALPLVYKTIRLEEHYPDSAQAWGDVRMVELIVRNLLSNAVKFTPSDRAVYLSVRQMGREVWVSVRDEGIGMSAAQVSKLGSLEQRCVRPGTVGEQGTGLGLILSYSMARRNGARIEVASAEGVGTTMSLVLRTGPRASHQSTFRAWLRGQRE